MDSTTFIVYGHDVDDNAGYTVVLADIPPGETSTDVAGDVREMMEAAERTVDCIVEIIGEINMGTAKTLSAILNAGNVEELRKRLVVHYLNPDSVTYYRERAKREHQPQ